MTDTIEKVENSATIASYAVIPLRDIVVFPSMVVSLFVGRDKSIKALEKVMNEDQKVLLLTQKDLEVEEPNGDDLYHYGVVAEVKQLLKLPDGTVKVLVEGGRRVSVNLLSDVRGVFHATVKNVIETENEVNESSIYMKTLSDKFSEYAKIKDSISADVLNNISILKTASELSDTLVQYLNMGVPSRQSLLEEVNPIIRLEKLYVQIEEEIDIANVEKRIRDRVKEQMEKNQREYFLNEKIKAISKELGDDTASEMDEYNRRLDASRMPAEIKTKAKSELKKLKSMPPVSAESSVVRIYVEWLLDVPWKKRSKINIDIERAEEILDEDHCGLEKVKDRILELLAVNIRTKKVKGPILCLVGPPGVGKTSLGKSIAKACGRKYVRMALGGVRDEAEMRGHRRTYVGAMPGKIIQSMKKAGKSNPMILLDEIEKMGYDHRGDPTSALLEILDPAQNSTFSDHYMEVDYDLSEVMFVTTANTLNMPAPLLDRMEIIQLSGYTEDEKLEIAKRHLVQRTLTDNDLSDEELSISDDAIVSLVRYYTREAGVRNLEREIQKIARKVVKELLVKKHAGIVITAENIDHYSGIKKYSYGITEDEHAVGMVTGLAWTSDGGEILTIESALVPGKGKVSKTGKLGSVMQESISAAETYIRANAPELGIKPTLFNKRDIHVHVPEGATPKDGPSAGVGMVTAMVSSLTKNPVKKDVAMTGEVTLRGKVLGIGGLKEKLLAALRGGIKTAIIPAENEKDLVDIPENVKASIRIIPVSHVREALDIALANPLESIEWNQEEADLQQHVSLNSNTNKSTIQ